MNEQLVDDTVQLLNDLVDTARRAEYIDLSDFDRLRDRADYVVQRLIFKEPRITRYMTIEEICAETGYSQSEWSQLAAWHLRVQRCTAVKEPEMTLYEFEVWFAEQYPDEQYRYWYRAKHVWDKCQPKYTYVRIVRHALPDNAWGDRPTLSKRNAVWKGEFVESVLACPKCKLAAKAAQATGEWRECAEDYEEVRQAFAGDIDAEDDE